MAPLLPDIRRFLNASFYEGTQPVRPDLRYGLFPFVTISREYGAGGWRLAETLIQTLESQNRPFLRDWKIFDRKLCEEVISDPELRNSIGDLLTEEYHSEVESLVYSLLGRPSKHKLQMHQLFQTIRTLATFGKVIIVGRAGALITGSLPLGVHVRLAAPIEVRARSVDLGELPLEEVLSQMDRRDQDRARMVKAHFNRDIADPTLYDAIWNTDRVEMESIAEAILALLLRRWSRRKAHPQ